MIEWVSLSSGPRPIPRPVATPLVWANAVGGALQVTFLITSVGPDHPRIALAAPDTALARLAHARAAYRTVTAATATATEFNPDLDAP